MTAPKIHREIEPDDPLYWLNELDDEDDLENKNFDCGWNPVEGRCEDDGTEHCQFDCPYYELMNNIVKTGANYFSRKRI